MNQRALVYDPVNPWAAETVRALAAAGVEVTVAPDLESALAFVREGGYDLIVAGGSQNAGWDPCSLLLALRREGESSLALVLTLPEDPGAVPTDPRFPEGAPALLPGRARALDAGVTTSTHIVRRAGIEVDRLSQQVRYRGAPIVLTPHEYRILECLILEDGLVSRERIGAAAWGVVARNSNVIDVHLGNLRRKLSAVAGRPLIRTVRGRGFMLDARRAASHPGNRKGVNRADSGDRG